MNCIQNNMRQSSIGICMYMIIPIYICIHTLNKCIFHYNDVLHSNAGGLHYLGSLPSHHAEADGSMCVCVSLSSWSVCVCVRS